MTGSLKEMIIETYGAVQRIDERTAKTDKAVDTLCKKAEDHDVRIRTLETKEATHEAVEEVKEKWVKRHPVVTGLGIGGISIGTIVTFILGILTYLKII